MVYSFKAHCDSLAPNDREASIKSIEIAYTERKKLYLWMQMHPQIRNFSSFMQAHLMFGAAV